MEEGNPEATITCEENGRKEMEYLLLIAGFILLIKGADLFVDGASAIAKKLRVPSVIIGLTIVAFGTSAPEAAVSITAALEGNNGIAVGNIVGSNLFNLLVVVGISAILRTVPVEKNMLYRDYPLSIVAAIVLFLLSFDTKLGNSAEMVLSRGDGFVLLVFFGIFMYVTITSAFKSRKTLTEETGEKEQKSTLACILFTAIGIAGIVIGGDLTVNSASEIAKTFGMSDTLIGLTIVAVGTSLPELVTSIVATKKGENDLALGNVVGSNLFNIFFILGTSSAIHSITLTTNVIYDMIMLIVINLIVFAAILKPKRVSKPLGGFMVLSYVGYMLYAILR